MGGCSVQSCNNRFVRGSKHFFRYPKDQWRRELWSKFTQRKNYEPKMSSTICQDHFTDDCFQMKKDRMLLSKEAVPTILYRDSRKYEIRFDPETRKYFEEDFNSITMNPIDKEEQILEQKQTRINELKAACRFCITTDNLIELNKLESYSIKFEDLANLLGFETHSDLFSDVLCEQCFQQIVEFDVFRKKVKETHEDVIAEIQQFDEKISGLRNNFEIVQLDEASGIEILEEHIIDEEFIEDGVEYIEDITEDFIENIEASENDEFSRVEEEEEEEEIFESYIDGPAQGVDEYEMVSTDDIIKNPERNRFCFRIYECFFCKMVSQFFLQFLYFLNFKLQKFAGRKTYVAHKCPISQIKCEKCDKTFSKLQAYNSHLSHVHDSLPITKNYCPICKTVIIATRNQFKHHRRLCNKKASLVTIECEICGKICNNLKGYSIHKLFHETRNYTTSTGEKIASEGLNVSKGVSVCELCGKEFQSQSGYRMHRRNVHRIGYDGEVFACKMCTKTCPTRRSLFDHVRNTHRVQETPCNVCGKVFRTKILLQKHMMYHDESKRVFFCSLCPDKPGYFTKVALQRHQKSHLGKKDFHCDECGKSFTTNHQLKVHTTNKHENA